jgi:lysozyme
MRVSDKAIEMLCHHEGVRRKPYQDCIGLWTVGVGHLIGKTLLPEWNRILTMDEVHALLKEDVTRFEAGVPRLCPAGLTGGRFDALVSFTFNTGLGCLQRSSIRMRHNRGDFGGAADAFKLYNKASGKVFQGLVTRRKDERAVYLGA